MQKLASRLSDQERAKTVVTILIDHSGSMRGKGIMAACLAAEVVWRALDRCGVPSEIIGFTTSSWKGGQARVKWVMDGRPANPGRLCDIRYIHYRSAEDPRAEAPDLSNALHSALLKENVDGEAILHAADRLAGGDWERKAIVILSDGAPVDDSTIASNADKDIRLSHLGKVIADVEAGGIGLGYVLLEERASAVLPGNSAMAPDPVAACAALFDVTARALGLDPAASDLDPASA